MGGGSAGSAVSGERAGQRRGGGRKEGTGKRGCAEYDGAGGEAGWVSRQATAGAVAGTRPIGPATGVWTSTRPPPDATKSRRSGPQPDPTSTGTWTWVSPSPRCLSLGPKKLNTLAGGTLPCLDRGGAPRPPRPCKGRPSESYPSCGAQRAMNFSWWTSVCSTSRSLIQAQPGTEDDCGPRHYLGMLLRPHAPRTSLKQGRHPLSETATIARGPLSGQEICEGGAARLRLLTLIGRTSLFVDILAHTHSADPDRDTGSLGHRLAGGQTLLYIFQLSVPP